MVLRYYMYAFVCIYLMNSLDISLGQMLQCTDELSQSHVVSRIRCAMDCQLDDACSTFTFEIDRQTYGTAGVCVMYRKCVAGNAGKSVHVDEYQVRK